METVHDMLDAIYPDPYETEIGRAILNSTNVSQTDEDWAQIIRVCELVNSSQEGPSLAIRAMTRLITPNPDHPITTHQQILAMSVLEALVKNCGRRFHHQLTWRPFIRAVRNSLEDQVSMPILVQDRLKSMLQSWALVFATEPDLKPLCDLYAELRSTIDFPTEDLISSPISTRPTQDCGSDDTGRLNPDETGFASTARNVLSSIRQRAANAFSSISTQSPQPAKSTTASTSPRLDKIRSELSVVETDGGGGLIDGIR